MPTATKSRTAAIYCRISSDPKGLRAGVQRQEEDCRAFCVRHGWTMADVFIDNDISAYSGKPRPEYRRMLDAIEAGQLDAVVVWHPDRLHRSPSELEEFISMVERTSCAVGTVTAGDYDLTTPAGRMTARVVGAVARGESEHKSERVRRAAQQAAERGSLSVGGSRCFGYRGTVKDEHGTIIQRDDGTVVPEEAKTIRQMAKWFLDGTTYRQIAVQLNTAGVLTTMGNTWSGSTVAQLLKSPRIAGFRDYNGAMFKGDWSPLLDAATWRAVKEAAATAKRPAERQTDIKHPFTGIIRCGTCGGRMNVMKWRQPRTGQMFPRYACVKNPGTPNCGHVAASKVPVDKMIRWEMNDAVLSHHFPGADAVASAEAELIDIEKALDAIGVACFVKRILTEDRYLAGKADLEDQRAIVIGQLKSANVNRPKFSSMKVGELNAWWDTAPIAEQRALFRSVIERIDIMPAKHRGGNVFDHDRVKIITK